MSDVSFVIIVAYALPSVPGNNDEVKTTSCITCDSIEDPGCKDDINSGMSKECPQNQQQSMGCYHFEENNKIKRGCISAIEDESLRNICTSNNDKCKSCRGNDCNSRQSGFLKCLSGDQLYQLEPSNPDTSALESKMCTNYIDECYIHVANNIVQRGCLCDAIQSQNDKTDLRADCENVDVCEKCSDQNDCNNRIIETEYCTICDANDEPNCKHAPSSLMRGQCPLSIRPFGCLMLKNDTMYVKRDCMSSDTSLRQLCLKESDECKYCFGDECNMKEYFAQCFSCRSDADKNGEDCIQRPWLTKLKTCTPYMDECFTHISEDGIATRGCFDDFHLDSEQCTNGDTCWRCNGPLGCNRFVVQSEYCLLCDSSENPLCKGNFTSSISTRCPQKTIMNLGCFQFINKSNGHTKRGCISSLSTIEQQLAKSQLTEWKHCKGRDNCNSRESFLKCFSCNSNDDANCVSNPTSSEIAVKVCNSYEDSCFSLIGAHNVSRGCLNELDWNLIVNYRSSPNRCDICTSYGEDICNDKKLKKFECVVCDSDTDEKCRNQPELFTPELCGLAGSDNGFGCFLSKDKTNRVRRGCVSDFTDATRKECPNSLDECRICSSQFCNKKDDFQQCWTCSSRDNSNCSHDNVADVTLSVCPNYMDKCLTAIDIDGFTVRKCISDQTDGDKEHLTTFAEFETCEDSKCNAGIFPKNRLKCFQCDGGMTCDLLQTSEKIPLEARPCRTYSIHDQCFTYHDGCKCEIRFHQQ